MRSSAVFSKFEERMNILKASKKVLSLLLAAMMVFSGVTCAFADEVDTAAEGAPDTEVSVEESSESTEPEATEEPEATAEPTATPEASATPEPTATPDPNAVTEEQIEELKALVETAKANIEYKGTDHTLQNATEEVEEILADTESLTKDTAEDLINEYSEIVDNYTVVFTNMNIPYSTFFAAYTSGSNLTVVQQDVVTTATTNKMNMTTSLAKGTYNDGTNICGVTMIVRMFKKDYEQIKDAHENQGGDYGFTVIEPKTSNDYEFMRLTINSDGSYKFKPSYINLDSRGLSVGEFTTDTSYGDYQFTLLGAAADGTTCGVWSDVTYYAMVVKTSYQTGYAMYALNNLWFASRNTNGLEVAWSVVGGQGLTNHGGQQFYQYDGMNGQDIVQIALYTSRGVITMGSSNGASFTLPAYYTGDVSELGAKIDTASTEVEISGVPSDLENPKVTITYSPGRHQNVTVVENADIVDGKVQLESALEFGQNYVIKLTSDNYAQITVPYTQATDLTAVSAYGSTFYAADLKNLKADNIENVTFRQTVSGRGGTTVTEYAYSDLATFEGTTFVYTGAEALDGDLYAFTKNDAVSYADLYKSLGATVDVDVVSSATNFSGYHAKDISDIVSYGFDADGNKVITGVSTEKSYYTVDAKAYLTAAFKNAFGYELSEDETALLSATLKANASVAPSETTVEVKVSSAEYTTSRYGLGEFVIMPDDTVEGYVWNEYWNNVYGATISDGTTTVGAVHWVDLYGENSESGYHYNKIELALNNGTSIGANAAEVTRFASFFDADNNLKDGTYTITVKAAGYSDLVATVTVGPKDQEITIGSSKVNGDAVTAYTNWADFSLDASAETALTYASSDESVATVSSTGVVTVVGAGTCNITVSAEATDDYKAAEKTIAVTVKRISQTITIGSTYVKSDNTATAYANWKGFSLNAKASTALKYASSDESVAKVSSTGAVTIVGGGTCNITVTAVADSKYASAKKTIALTVKKINQTITIKTGYLKGDNTITCYADKGSINLGASASTALRYVSTTRQSQLFLRQESSLLLDPVHVRFML